MWKGIVPPFEWLRNLIGFKKSHLQETQNFWLRADRSTDTKTKRKRRKKTRKKIRCHISGVTHHILSATCQVSGVFCCVSPVMYH